MQRWPAAPKAEPMMPSTVRSITASARDESRFERFDLHRIISLGRLPQAGDELPHGYSCFARIRVFDAKHVTGRDARQPRTRRRTSPSNWRTRCLYHGHALFFLRVHKPTEKVSESRPQAQLMAWSFLMDRKPAA